MMKVADIITPFTGGSTMRQITTLGIDTAKQVFQLHGVNAQGNVVLHKRVTRTQLLPLLAQLPQWLLATSCQTPLSLDRLDSSRCPTPHADPQGHSVFRFNPDESESQCRLGGKATTRRGNVGVARPVHQANDRVAQRRHHLWDTATAHL